MADNKVVSFRTRRLQEFDVVFARVSESFTKISKGDKGSEIFLDDLGLINDFAALKQDIKQLKKEGKTDLVEKIEKCSAIIHAIETMKIKTQTKAGFFSHIQNQAFHFFMNAKISPQLVSQNKKSGFRLG